jgi:GxxExxY protein
MNSKTQLLEAGLTDSVIGSFFDVHRELGFGYREYLYALALERDLIAKGHKVDREVGVMVYFRGEPLARQTLGMVIDEKLVLEIKARSASTLTARSEPSLDPRSAR